jgi:L-threonylcarbamoyladenylate synthase
MHTRTLPATPEAIADAARLIRADRLVAFPTETVYGLGANALSRAAVLRIFEAKERPADDPLIVHVAATEEIAEVADQVPRLATELAARFWPGPLTLVLPRGPAVPLEATAGRDTVAVRLPAHPVAQALIKAAARPIAAPSANLYARPSPTTAAHVLEDLDGRIDLVLDGGPTLIGVESTVLDLTTDVPRLLRPGGVTVEQLRDALGDRLVVPTHVVADSTSPGTAERHYSPRARVDLFDGATPAQLAAHAASLAARGERVALLTYEGDPIPSGVDHELLGPSGDWSTAAQRLYAALRALDERGVDTIVATLPPPEGLALALRDRLRRAAHGRILTPDP